MSKLWLIALALCCVACEPSELRPAPVGGGSGGYSYQQPRSSPIAPGYDRTEDPGNVEGQRETHAVTTRNDCDEMARRFRQQGRRVQLVERRYVGGQLPYLCIFEGEDAQSGYFDDNRYR